MDTGVGPVLEVVGASVHDVAADRSRLDGASVSDVVTVVVRGGGAIDEVRYVLNGAADGTPDHVATEAPFAIQIDTRSLADGTHTLTATLVQRAGRERVLSAEFDVANGGGDGHGGGDGTPGGGTSPDGGTPDGGTPGGGTVTPPPAETPLPPATLFVATNGSDANSGRSLDQPLRTLQRAANLVQPGDVVYVRGGVYPIQVGFNTSGTQDRPIVWTSFPGERAILDGADQTPVSSQHRVWVTNVRWNVFMNLEVRNGPQSGIFIRDSDDNVFRNIVTHGNHLSGIHVMNGNRNRFEYIVTYDNYDRYNPSGRIGDDADGLSISSGDRNHIYAVVAFDNSDDGIDTWRSTNTIVERSIAFNNGRGSHGNGNGFKAGGNSEVVNTIVRHSVAFNNRANGFDDNSGRNVRFFNNTAFGNGRNFAFGSTSTLRNNLSYAGPIGNWGGSSSHNSWDLGISDPAFVSVDPSSPAFLSLSATSRAIGAGIDVGLPYAGSAPDLGAVPYQHVLAQAVTYLPTTVSATIAAAAPH